MPNKKSFKKSFKLLIASLIVAGGVAVTGYNRSDFVHWIDSDGDCQDTRTEVLIRDADGPITLDSKGCNVLSGIWIDPYTGETFTNPKDIDIDHLVPLKNAFESGADKWTKDQRKYYANYLGNNYHLLAVKASENRKKGAKGPEQYLPPKEDYQCEYVKLWSKVKNEWKLSVTSYELQIIKLTCEK